MKPIEAKNVNVYYGDNHVLKDISLNIRENSVTAFIGPSGCGKSTFLRTLNRMNDYIDGFRKKGKIYINGRDIYDKKVRVEELRRKVGMVFQKPNPFPKSIFENVAYGLRLRGIGQRSALAEKVEQALRNAALWEEVKDRLREGAYNLSGGQQQRLCIARAMATEPELVLFDEPTSALDPTATARVEELVTEIKSRVTVIIVTHNMQQASRISDFTGFMYLGELAEFDRTGKIFTNPGNRLTEEYITGRLDRKSVV